MATLNINIPDEVRYNFMKLAQELKEPEEKLITHLMANYLTELREDIEDYNDGMQVLEEMKRNNEKPIPLAEVKRELGLLED